MDDDGSMTDVVHRDGMYHRIVAPPFIAPEILQDIAVEERKEKLARIIETRIVPRLSTLHFETLKNAIADPDCPIQEEIETLAKLTLASDISESSNYLFALKERGLSMDGLFVNLLEPTARHLGIMWDNDECDFVDVSFGVARLQQLLSMFNCTLSVPAFAEKRRVCMMTIAGEKHNFGVAMVEKFLRAGGWRVDSERGVDPEHVSGLVRSEWYPVIGVTISSDQRAQDLAAIITAIRENSRNPAIGIMVGGPPFNDDCTLAATIGADATATNAPTAVLLAQKLFDIGAQSDWQGSYVP